MKALFYLFLFIVFMMCWTTIAEAQQWFPKRVVAMEYPVLAVQAKIHGTVKLLPTIDNQGNVRDAKVIVDEEAGGHHLLADAARQNILEWRFAKQPSSTTSTEPPMVTYTFKLEGPATSGKRQQSFVFEYPGDVLINIQPACSDHLPCGADERQRFHGMEKQSAKKK